MLSGINADRPAGDADTQQWANRNMTLSRVRAIEFFAGIGGFACAAEQAWPHLQLEVTAIDIDHDARTVYQLNHHHRYVTAEIQSLSTSTLAQMAADMWWLSPPCQPYSRRGQQRDIDDPRAASLLVLVKQIEQLRPRMLALENVQGFEDSRAFDRLNEVLNQCGYFSMSKQLCPTEMGWPNRRPRFYLLASLEPLRAWDPLPRYEVSLSQLIEHAEFDAQDCLVDGELVERFSIGMDRVDPLQAGCVSACFGSSYGKSLLHAGSYCQHGSTWRRFAPVEVARLLGFPRTFALPKEMTNRRLWKLLGNSLSIPAVEYVLRHLFFVL